MTLITHPVATFDTAAEQAAQAQCDLAKVQAEAAHRKPTVDN